MGFSVWVLGVVGFLGWAGPLPPFDPTIPCGKYLGQMVDTERWRSAEPLPSEWVARYFGKPDKQALDVRHVKHGGRWWHARIPLQVDSLYFVRDYFAAAVPAAHAELLVVFPEETPAILRSQEGREVAFVHELILSSDAGRPKEVVFDLLDGSLGNYPFVHSVRTLEQLVEERWGDANHILEATHLDGLNAATRARVLKHWFARPFQRGYRETYRTITNNCCEAALGPVDRASGHGADVQMLIAWAAGLVGEAYPPAALLAIQLRGYVRPKSYRKLRIPLKDLPQVQRILATGKYPVGNPAQGKEAK